MKQVEKIWAELSAKAQEVETPQEVELSEEQKVELNSVGELKGLISDAKRIISLQEDGLKMAEKAEAQFKEVMKVVNDAEEITREAIIQSGNKTTEIEKVLSKLEDSANELGINYNDIDGWTDSLFVKSELDKNEDVLKGVHKMLKKML